MLFRSFKMKTEFPWLLNAIPSRLNIPAQGCNGGGAGRPGSFLINGEQLLEAKKREMQPTDEVLMETPGGGGFGSPA